MPKEHIQSFGDIACHDSWLPYPGQVRGELSTADQQAKG